MKLRYTLALLATFAFVLSGCVTAQMWENIDNSKESLAFIDDDLLTSFRVTRQAAGNLPSRTLIMGGMTNWYVLDETSSRTIAPYLTAGLDLSHRYTLKRPLPPPLPC